MNGLEQPPEEISEISASGFPIETHSQAQERRDREELRSLKDRYGGMTGVTTNIVKALGYDGLAAYEKGEGTTDQKEMFKFLETELTIDTEKSWKTDAISLDELNERIEQKRKLYQPTDPRNETAGKLQTLVELAKKDIERGKKLF